MGLDGVNPFYYDSRDDQGACCSFPSSHLLTFVLSFQLLYTSLQSVGITGRRPLSSYYFVGVQGDGFF
ncbi:hypothetical protein B0H11DRAFT_1766117 [Mycena galericulata]|nr:hypothetical protein B0H11DRAFT_1766117 [Mycena galericulata]